MKTLKALAGAASMIGMALWASAVAAEEPGSAALFPAGDTAVEPLSLDELAAATGGHAVDLAATVGQGVEFSDNDVSVDGAGRLETGSIVSLVGNSGGVNNVMLNSGNNVSFQNSTILNLYMGGTP